MRLTHDPAPPGSLRPGIPRKLESVVIRALARDPAERFQSAEEMSAAIEEAFPGAEPSLPEPPYQEPPPPRSLIRSWLAVPLILALTAALAVGGLVVLEGLDTDGDTSAGPGAVPTAPLAISGAYPHDPLGGDGEHDDAAPLAIDGDATTYWTTEGYNQDLGIEKDGVGLIVELRDQAEVGRLRIATDTPGWEFSVFAADEPGAFDPAGSPVDGPNTAEDGGTYEIKPTEARYVLIWITGLVQTDRYRAHINEIDLLPPSG